MGKKIATPPKKSAVQLPQNRPQQAKPGKFNAISNHRVRRPFYAKYGTVRWFLCRHNLPGKVLLLLVTTIFVRVGFDEMPLQEEFRLVFSLCKLYTECFSTVRIHKQYAHFSIFCNFLIKSIKFWRISLAEPTILFS